MFVGRDEILIELNSRLEPSYADNNAEQRSRSSCVVHGLGGMGKTETVNEYTYRYRNCYSHIIWLRAQSNTVLTESFVTAVRKLGLSEEATSLDKTIDLGLDWFESTGKNTNPNLARRR